MNKLKGATGGTQLVVAKVEYFQHKCMAGATTRVANFECSYEKPGHKNKILDQMHHLTQIPLN